jgi:bromodomain-containing protein 7
VEDPFSVLSALVPDPPCAAPLVTPLFPPPPSQQQDSSQQITLPLPINVPLPTEIPTPTPIPAATAPSATPVSQPTPTESKSKYRHWTITRPAPQRGKTKDPTVEERAPTPEWRKPRPLHTADYGLFPSFATTGPSSPGGKSEALATQERLFGALYASLENPAVAVGSSETSTSSSASIINKRPTATATDAQSWLREVVYGGWDGLAYTRSVAEFVTLHANPSPNPDGAKVKNEDDVSDRGSLDANAMLAGYVDAVLVDELTEGRHRMMEAAIAGPVPGEKQDLLNPVTPSTQLDLGSLISAPSELFDAEKAWVGAGANEDSTVLARALDHATHLLEQLQEHAQCAARIGEAGAEGMDVDVDVDVNAESVSEGGKKERRGGDLETLETELRMNLIALAKRAPLDQIARMPSELVPPHLRRVVPTIGY